MLVGPARYFLAHVHRQLPWHSFLTTCVLASCGGSSHHAVSVNETSRTHDSGATADARAIDSGVDAGSATDERGLSWPIDCLAGSTCSGGIVYPDIDGDGKAFDCSSTPKNHQGTSILITPEQMMKGVDVYAAAAGEVLWVFDGKYDQCPNAAEPDCADPIGDEAPGRSSGYQVCTPKGPYCGTGACCCFYCFNGGNVVVIRHQHTPGVFATRYDSLKRGSIRVAPGDHVERGQKIAEVGAAGDLGAPGLTFHVWGTGFYELADPWAGKCEPSKNTSLWRSNPP